MTTVPTFCHWPDTVKWVVCVLGHQRKAVVATLLFHFAASKLVPLKSSEKRG